MLLSQVSEHDNTVRRTIQICKHRKGRQESLVHLKNILFCALFVLNHDYMVMFKLRKLNN